MARDLKYTISGDDRDFRRTLRSVDQNLDRSERRAHKFSRAFQAAIGVGAVATLGAFAKKAIDSASDVNEALTKNQALFGRHAKGIERWAQSTADNLGIGRKEALAASGTFGGLFGALKIGQAPAAQMSQRLVRLAADLASFNNASPDEVLLALRSGLSGEAEPMRRFNAFLSEGRVKAEAYKSGIARTGSELTEQQKVQARYNLILSDTVQAHGDFKRTAGGTANQTRILKARYEDLKATLGEKLLPAVNRGIAALNRFIGQMKSGKAAGGDFARTLKDVAQAGEDVAQFLRDHPGLIKGAIAAWATYKVASLATLASIKVGTFRRMFMRSVPAAGAAGAAAGGTYSAAFTAASSAGIAGAAKGGKFLGAARAIGRAIGPVAALLIATEIANTLGTEFIGHKGGTQGQIDKTAAGVRDIIDDARNPNPAIKAPRGGVPRDPDFRPSAATRRSGRRSRRPRQQQGARRSLNDRIRAQQDTIQFNLQMDRITEGVAASQLEALAGQVKKGKALRRELLVSAKGLRDQALADAKQVEEDAEQARRDAAEARKAAAQKQRDAAKSARQYMRDQRRSHREELRRVRKRKRGDDGSNDFQLNVGDVRVPTVYEVRRHGAMRAAAESPRITGSKAQPTTTVNGGVHITIDGAKNPKQVAAEVAAVFDHTRKTHGRAVKRAQARARAKR